MQSIQEHCLKCLRVALLPVLAALAATATTVKVSAQRISTIDAPASGTLENQGTQATGINNLGTIVGNVTDANYATHGFIRAPNGKFKEFDLPGADATLGCTCPQAINDFGVIVGYYTDSTGLNHGFLRGPEGKTTPFDPPGAGGYGTTPITINLEGAVVGYYTDPNYLFHAFLRRPDGTFSTFVGPDACDTGTSTGCYGSADTYIDLFGFSVGNFEDNSGNFVGHNLLRSPRGNITIIDAPGAGTGPYQGTGCPGCTAGLNLWGAMAATYTDANNVHHGFLRTADGEFTTFDVPGAGTGSYEGTGCFSDCPVGLNDRGEIAGIYIDSNFVYHGYLRSREGKFTTVDAPESAGTDFIYINDIGAITGYYSDASGAYHGFLRLP